MHCVTAMIHCKMKQEIGQNYLLVILRDIDGVDLLVCGDHEKGSLTNLTKTKTYKHGRHMYMYTWLWLGQVCLIRHWDWVPLGFCV